MIYCLFFIHSNYEVRILFILVNIAMAGRIARTSEF